MLLRNTRKVAILLLGVSLAGAVMGPAQGQITTSGPSAARSGPPSPFPKTRAGEAAKAWLEQFNSSDPRLQQQYRAKYQPERAAVDLEQRLRRETGGFDLLELRPENFMAGPQDPQNQMLMVLRERKSGEIRLYTLSVTARGPLRVTGLIAGSLIPYQPALVVPPERLDDAALSIFADDFIGRLDFSGVILMSREGRTVFAKARGFADRDTRTPFTPQSRFHVGSMSRVFTSVALLRLAQAGKVDLDAPISGVSLRSRMTAPPTPDSDIVLAQAVQNASGQGYPDYVRANLFAPAGMTNSGFSERGQTPDGVVKVYCAELDERGDGSLPSERYASAEGLAPDICRPPNLGVAAGMYTTAADLAAFAKALTKGELLDPASTRTITTGSLVSGGFWHGTRAPAYGLSEINIDWAPRLIASSSPSEADAQVSILGKGNVVVVTLSNLDRPSRARQLNNAVALRVLPRG